MYRSKFLADKAVSEYKDVNKADLLARLSMTYCGIALGEGQRHSKYCKYMPIEIFF